MHNLKLKIPTPIDWPTMAINQVCLIVSRGTAPIYVTNSNIYAVGQRCVQLSGFDQSAARPHNETKLERVLWAKQGDILLNSTGTGTIGRSCIFTAENNAYIVDGHVTLIRPNEEQLDGRWLNTLLQSHYGQSHLEIYCYSGSTNQVELSKEALATSYIPLPPSSEQQRIAHILNALDTQIQQTEQLIAKLKQMKAGRLHDLLTRGIDENGDMRDPVAHPEDFKESLLGKLPKKWTDRKLKDFYAEPARNGLYKPAKYYGKGNPMIHMPQMFRGLVVDTSDAARVEVTSTEQKRFGLKSGDLVFARRSLNLEGAGRCSLVPELIEPTTFESSIIRVRLSQNQLRPAFANYYLNSAGGFRQRLPLIRQVAASGVSSEDIASMLVPCPSVEEQDTIIQLIKTHDTRIAAEDADLAKLKLIKKGLMHDLLTGCVRVTQLITEREHLSI